MTAMTTPHHQVAAATARMRAAADSVVDASVWSMTAAEAASTLLELTRLEAQVVELRARVAAHADELQVGHDVGATSTATWLAHQTRLTRSTAGGVVHLGYNLGTHDIVRDALAAGHLRPEQASVILRALKDLPADLDPEPHGRSSSPTDEAAKLGPNGPSRREIATLFDVVLNVVHHAPTHWRWEVVHLVRDLGANRISWQFATQPATDDAID